MIKTTASDGGNVMANPIINIVDKEVADKLIKSGFHCFECKSNDKTVYQFVSTPELMNMLIGRFEKTDFFISKNLCF
jgi:hypothetical protein